MADRVFLPKWCELVIALYNTQPNHRYKERLHRKTGITTRHLRSLVGDLEQMGIVQVRQPKNKEKYIDLTEAGEKIAVSMLRIYPKLKRPFQ